MMQVDETNLSENKADKRRSKVTLHRLILVAAFFAALCQLAYWSCLAVFEAAARPNSEPLAQEVLLHLSGQDGSGAAAEAIPVKLSRDPAYIYRDPGGVEGGVFAFEFLHEGAADDLGLMLGWGNDIAEVRLNGQVIRAQTPADRWGVLVGWHPVVYILPKEAMHEGANEITIRVTRDYVKVLPYYFVDAPKKIMKAFSWANAVTFDLVIAATAIMVFVILLCFAIDWTPEDRLRKNALIAVLSIWAIKNATYLGFDPFPGWFNSLALNYSIAFALPISFLFFASAWTSIFPKVRKWLIYVYCVLLLLPVSLLLFPDYDLSRFSWNVEMILSIICMIAVIGVFSWDAALRRERHVWLESFLFVFCASAILSDAIDERFYITFPFTKDFFVNYYVHPAAGLLLALGTSAVLAAHATRARRVVTDMNNALSEKLAEREAEIRAHEKEKAIQSERRRIMRDMHDGLGSRLTFLSALARRNDAPREELVAGLDEGLGEMRLIVDSLDTAGESLDIALGAFRERIEPRLAAANISLVWRVEAVASERGFEAHTILQIFRVLQEACANALRHAHASELRISLREAESGLVLTVKDDGVGLRSGHRLGVGMTSMQQRAESIGAILEIRNMEPGLAVVLTIPDRQAKPTTNE